jgi:hypothetical protein
LILSRPHIRPWSRLPKHSQSRPVNSDWEPESASLPSDMMKLRISPAQVFVLKTKEFDRQPVVSCHVLPLRGEHRILRGYDSSCCILRGRTLDASKYKVSIQRPKETILSLGVHRVEEISISLSKSSRDTETSSIHLLPTQSTSRSPPLPNLPSSPHPPPS